MWLGVAGSREIPKWMLHNLTDRIRSLEPGSVVVSGGARGVDRQAEHAANQFNVPVVSFRPYNTGIGEMPWAINRVITDPYAPIIAMETTYTLPERYRSFAAAAFVRNGYIVECSTDFHIVWDGHSRGTKDTLRKAQQHLGLDKVELERVDLPRSP